MEFHLSSMVFPIREATDLCERRAERCRNPHGAITEPVWPKEKALTGEGGTGEGGYAVQPEGGDADSTKAQPSSSSSEGGGTGMWEGGGGGGWEPHRAQRRG